jgi:hypothetical protein
VVVSPKIAGLIRLNGWLPSQIQSSVTHGELLNGPLLITAVLAFAVEQQLSGGVN